MSFTPALTLRDVAYDDPLAVELIDEIQADLTMRYGGPDETPTDPADFAPPSGIFVIALVGDDVVGCAGLRRHGDDAVELKRMYVRAGHRRRGHARALLTLLEDRAETMGAHQLVLETGEAQPEAIALYEAAGYHPVLSFGYYGDEPGSRSFGKDL